MLLTKEQLATLDSIPLHQLTLHECERRGISGQDLAESLVAGVVHAGGSPEFADLVTGPLMQHYLLMALLGQIRDSQQAFTKAIQKLADGLPQAKR